MDKIILIPLILLFSMNLLSAQSVAEDDDEAPDESGSEAFYIGLEFRPRTEYRNGYRRIRSDTTNPAVFTDNRSRLYFTYENTNFIFHTSIQNVWVWGEDDPRSTEGTLQLYEAYVEPAIAPNFSVRIGRQKIMYDNQRLFAQNNWRQNGGSHDAVRLMYKNDSFEGDLIGAYNQEEDAQERYFETDFSPGFDNYKVLLANFLHYKLNDKVTLTGINVADAFQDADNTKLTHWRFTNGGRVEHTGEFLNLTLAGYYQYGSNEEGRGISAYYLQPEIKWQLPERWTFRLGAEIFSGDDALNPEEKTHSFDPLYGVNHRFLGSMDYFTQFPNDLNGAGLIAPYLFNFYDINEKLTLRADFHLFYSQNNYVVAGETSAIDKFLAFENDWLIRYKVNDYTDIDIGYSFALVTESQEAIQNRQTPGKYQDWAFLMITFKPELLRFQDGKFVSHKF